jgi:hypothetical protein
MNIDFWADPACPWCWQTARWVVEQVQPHRDVHITWQPISLLVKNNTPTDSPFYERVTFTYGLLRVMESVRTAEGNDPLQRLYFQFGARIHHDKLATFDVAEALAAAGLSVAHAAAFDDESFDAEIRRRMDEGLALVGTDVGTPIIGYNIEGAERVGLFGPVISQVPSPADALKLWDAVVAAASVPGFWELKRTRTESPQPGARPVFG